MDEGRKPAMRAVAVGGWIVIFGIVFGLWLWLGWHLFIRGWEFFMENRL